MFVPIAVGLLTGTAFFVSRRRQKPTPTAAEAAENAVIFDTAINQVKDPDKLLALAKTFREEGLTVEATLLEQRAALNTASPEEKAERTAVYHKAMNSKNPGAIRDVANAFDEIGATGAAVSLRGVAKGLEDAEAAEAAAQQQREPSIVAGESD